jgi:hypothetical protein
MMPIAIRPNHSEVLLLSPVETGGNIAQAQLVVSFDKKTDLKKQFTAPACPLQRLRTRGTSDAFTLGTEEGSLCSDSFAEEREQMGEPLIEDNLSEQGEQDTQSSSSDVDVAVAEKPKLPEVEEPSVITRAVSACVIRKSIIKISPLDVIPVKEGRFCCWLQLPKPDMTKIRSLSVPSAATQAATEAQVRRRAIGVIFHEVLIRNYEQTIGDNPSVSYGPPISLDWDYEEAVPISLDEYEKNRGPRRNTRQMMLNYYNRKNLLTWRCGATEEQMKAAEQESNKIKGQRSMTKAFLPAQKFEEVFQSLRRKSKRMGGGRNA